MARPYSRQIIQHLSADLLEALGEDKFRPVTVEASSVSTKSGTANVEIKVDLSHGGEVNLSTLMTIAKVLNLDDPVLNASYWTDPGRHGMGDECDLTFEIRSMEITRWLDANRETR